MPISNKGTWMTRFRSQPGKATASNRQPGPVLRLCRARFLVQVLGLFFLAFPELLHQSLGLRGQLFALASQLLRPLDEFSQAFFKILLHRWNATPSDRTSPMERFVAYTSV